VPRLEAIGLTDLPEIAAGDDLAAIIEAAWRSQLGAASPHDILVVAQKIVSKAEDRFVRLSDVEPSALARSYGREHGKDPRLIELILRESKRIVRMDRGVLIAETPHGLVCANAGVDTSNVPPGYALTLPRDPDASAMALRDRLAEGLGVAVGVIVSDTFGRPWREGLTNVAIGLAGVKPLDDYRGATDRYGRELQVSVLAVADEIASAAELVMGKTSGIPAAVVRGLSMTAADVAARALLRPAHTDMFR
jgi:coenzyme F420-0:L-glutamate ligase/coenzyme F420-1:gamma-L-glutamate ligase